MFPEQRIGRAGPAVWPARSPELNPLDFYTRKHVKSTVYAMEVGNLEGLATTIREQI